MPTTIDPIGRHELGGALHLIPNGWIWVHLVPTGLETAAGWVL
jgi:hypothetical protein